MRKSIIPLIPVLILTAISGIICFNVLNGKLGENELWRIVASILGFLIFFILSLFLSYRLTKLKNLK